MLAKIRDLFGFTRHSYYLLSAFLLTCLLIVYVWWPLVEEYLALMQPYLNSGQYPWYLFVDWLLVGIFLFMSLTIMSRADLKTDSLIVFVGLCGGLVIESWGTQTNLWHYYTAERPPLWIIPAWPIASLSIDRITRLLDHLLPKRHSFYPWPFWLTFGGFYALMVWFVAPTFDKPYTLLALLICALMILAPHNKRMALLWFIAGAGLGYFLELWGTTRECWTYYTNETPPLFAVLAHGMAAVAFWRTGLLIKQAWQAFSVYFKNQKIIVKP